MSALRLIAVVLFAAVYWAVAGAIIFLLSYGLAGDCGLEETQDGVAGCIRQGQMIFLGGFIVALALYTVVLWRTARRQ